MRSMRTTWLKNRYMCPYRLGMLSAGLAIWVLVLDMGLSAVGIAAANTGSQTTPTIFQAPADKLLSVQKQIVLRTQDGLPVPGIEVQLAPAGPKLGGPETGGEVRRAITGPDGTATFSGLGQWVWMVSFSGSFGGKAIQPVQDQGKEPYGRTRAGVGFPVVVQRQEEDAPATPIVIQDVHGTAQPEVEVQPSMFVLVLVDSAWVPTLDLALPGEHPRPLSELQTTEASTETSSTGAHPSAGTSGVTTSTSGASLPGESIDGALRWLYLLPEVIGLLAVFRAWQDRQERRRESKQARVPSVRSDADVPEAVEDAR